MPANAFDAAVKLLKGRAKSRMTLERDLIKRGFSESEVDSALQKASELGYLDDAVYAQTKARAGVTMGRSRADILRRLEKDGVDRSLAERVMRQLGEEMGYDEVEVAQKLLHKRKLTGLKAAQALGRRGFSEETIERLVPNLNHFPGFEAAE
jgi:SOS response regulatory protein OraA/RecX